jgi:hypothetical protein
MMRLILFVAYAAVALGQCYTVTTNSLSFRTCAGVFCGRVGGAEYLNYGYKVTKVGGPVRNGDFDWLQVTYNGQTGWAASNWLQSTSCGGTPPPPNVPPPPAPSGGGSTGCAPGSSSVGKPTIFTYSYKAIPLWQPYGRTQFSWDNCASWYSAAGCMHNGLDFGFVFGSDVPAACAGWITSSTDAGGSNPMAAGPKSVVQHCGDYLVLYGHMSTTYSGFKASGESVGKSGNPGGYKGAGNDHLHFEVRFKTGASTTYSPRCVNPTPLFADKTNLISNKVICGDALTQPDITFGSANKCTQWCGCGRPGC